MRPTPMSPSSRIRRILRLNRYGKEGHEIHGRPAGSVMTVEFELEGQRFVALNGGPHFKFNEAVSFQVHCATQEEIDYFWRQARRGWRRGPLRLAEGPLGRLVAGRAGGAPGHADGPGSGEGRAGHEGLSADAEVRHRGAGARLRADRPRGDGMTIEASPLSRRAVLQAGAATAFAASALGRAAGATRRRHALQLPGAAERARRSAAAPGAGALAGARDGRRLVAGRAARAAARARRLLAHRTTTGAAARRGSTASRSTAPRSTGSTSTSCTSARRTRMRCRSSSPTAGRAR